jgi:hypothetical protein
VRSFASVGICKNASASSEAKGILNGPLSFGDPFDVRGGFLRSLGKPRTAEATEDRNYAYSRDRQKEYCGVPVGPKIFTKRTEQKQCSNDYGYYPLGSPGYALK